MIKKLKFILAKGTNKGLLDVAGLALVVGAVYLAFGLAPGLAVAGVTLLVLRFLME